MLLDLATLPVLPNKPAQNWFMSQRTMSFPEHKPLQDVNGISAPQTLFMASPNCLVSGMQWSSVQTLLLYVQHGFTGMSGKILSKPCFVWVKRKNRSRWSTINTAIQLQQMIWPIICWLLLSPRSTVSIIVQMKGNAPGLNLLPGLWSVQG